MTTVRVDDDVKDELDRLQGEVLAETGERISHSELLARLVRFARRREMDFLAEREEWRPPTREQMRRLFGRVKDWGVRTDASRIDDVLYGGKP